MNTRISSSYLYIATYILQKMFRRRFKSSYKLCDLFILTLYSTLWWTSWINLTDAKEDISPIVADENGRVLLNYTEKCFKITQNIETDLYYKKNEGSSWASVAPLKFGIFSNSDSTFYHISITELKVTDTGLYKLEQDRCSSSIRILEVQGKPVFKIKDDSIAENKLVVPSQENIKIICEKEGSNNSQMRVTLDGMALNGQQTIKPNSDFILVIVRWEGLYHFTISDVNKVLECSSDNSKLQTNVIIDVTVKPTVSITTPNFTIAEKEVTVVCTSKGRPATKMHWMLDDTRLTGTNDPATEENSIMIVKNNLKFIPNKNYNKKKLICLVTENETVKDEFPLDILYGPENVITSHRNINVINGDNAALVTCTADGNPTSTFNWLFNNQIIIHGSNLELKVVNKSDSGEYFCNASNGINTKKSEPLHIDVFYAPVCKDLVKKETKYFNTNMNLKCDVDSNPRPTKFFWYKMVNGKDHELPQSEGILVINDTNNSTYYCNITNIIGTSTRCEFQIIVSDIFSALPGAAVVDLVTIIVPIVIILIAMLLASVVIIVIIRRRKSKYKDQAGYELNQNERNSPGPDIIKTTDNTPIYAPVIKKNKKRDPSEEITYQNVGRVDEAVYQNVGEKLQKSPPSKKNQDGLIYANLDIPKSKSKANNTKPEKKEPPTEYATIDFTKKPPPTEETIKNEPIYYNSTTLADTNGQVSGLPPVPPTRRIYSSDV